MQNTSPANIIFQANSNSITLTGTWNWGNINEKQLYTSLDLIVPHPSNQLLLDGLSIDCVDSFGIFFINKIITHINTTHKLQLVIKLHKQHQELLNKISDSLVAINNQEFLNKNSSSFDNIENPTQKLLKRLKVPIEFLGQTIVSGWQTIKRPRTLGWQEIFRTIMNSGFYSIFVVLLLNFLIASTLAYEMAPQFTKYGANVYIVNFLGIAMLKEVSPLLTAIIIAGRTGSAITAEIGTMKIQEEIDALRTMGISPFQKLVLPKIIGVVIATPLLTVLGDIIGMIGGAIIANMSLNISYELFIERTQSYVSINNYTCGIIKSVAFGLSIAFIGCLRGFMVKGNSNSIGEQTTKSVVISIIMIIFLDAIFAIIFYHLGM